MKAHEQIPVVIIGGGPVGLFLGICLIKQGIKCRILEKRTDPVPDSRSLGIHPVSLELFDELGITDRFLSKGIKIKNGIAHTGKKRLGVIQFSHCKKPHNYILACPQFTTETILREELFALDKKALLTQAGFVRFDENKDSVVTCYSLKGKPRQQITSSYLIGCDGKNSHVRQAASIHYSGKRYPDTYIMGDFEDTTNFGNDATVFLPPAGLIECFPLPNRMRRWVVKTDDYIVDPNQKILADLVKKRIGFELHTVNSVMISSFGVQQFMAETFAKGRILLAGDSAHVVSPIGGQGMNLGWLGAEEAAKVLGRALKNPSDKNQFFKNYSKKRKKIAKQVTKRAEMNMHLGRKETSAFFYKYLLSLTLKTRLNTLLAKIFTMRGLGRWWV